MLDGFLEKEIWQFLPTRFGRGFSVWLGYAMDYGSGYSFF
jgi:hypothetical protein